MKTSKHTTADGAAVTVFDHGSTGSARFVAYRDDLPASVKGMAGTKAEAISNLTTAAGSR